MRLECKDHVTDSVLDRLFAAEVIALLDLALHISHGLSCKLAGFIKTAGHNVAIGLSDGLVEVGGKLMKLMGQYRFISK